MSSDLTADEKVAAFVLREFESEQRAGHIAACPSRRVKFVDGIDGEYGCVTGCEYARLEAVIECDHESTDFEYGEFGDLAGILAHIS